MSDEGLENLGTCQWQ